MSQSSSSTVVRFCIEIDHGANERQILWPRTVQSIAGNSNLETGSRDFRAYYKSETGEIVKSKDGIFEKTGDLESRVQLEPSEYCQSNAGFVKKEGGSSLFLDVEYEIKTESNWSLMYIDLN